jgi:hypothetical protein
MHEISDRIDDVLAGVQDQQHLTATERVDERCGRRPVRLFGYAEDDCHLACGQQRVGAVG